MSNCDFVAGESLIALATSRLALRAPALRAATALTGPKVMPMMMAAAVLLRRQNEGLADAAIA